MKRSEKILELLRQHGWSKKLLAERAGLKPRNVSYVISSSREPGVSTAIAIARALGVSSDWLFDDERDWPPPSTNAPQELTDYDLMVKLTNLVSSLANNAIAIRARLTKDRIERMNKLANMKDRSPQEQRELDQGFRDIALHDSATHRLELLMLSLDFVDYREDAQGGSFLEDLREPEYSVLVDAFVEYRSRLRRKSPAQLGWAKPPDKAYGLEDPDPKERPDSTEISPF